MATGQGILNLMEVLHPELQLQAGETDVTKGLLALNMAQDYMETVFALQPDFKGDTIGTVATATGVERTAFPTGVLRLDKMQYIDPSTSLPVYTLQDVRTTGGHIATTGYPLVNAANVQGAPEGYWTDGSYIYWVPVPNAVTTVRWYGFASQVDLTASGTFAYPDICMTPMALMAVRLIRAGLDDDTSAYIQLASDMFEPVVNLLSNFQRERAPGYDYRYLHRT